jgi:hypothetical protein
MVFEGSMRTNRKLLEYSSTCFVLKARWPQDLNESSTPPCQPSVECFSKNNVFRSTYMGIQRILLEEYFWVISCDNIFGFWVNNFTY